MKNYRKLIIPVVLVFAFVAALPAFNPFFSVNAASITVSNWIHLPHGADTIYHIGTGDGGYEPVRDPAIIREGNTYYMTYTVYPFAGDDNYSTSKENMGSSPGVRMFQSTDLMNWTPSNTITSLGNSRSDGFIVLSSELPNNSPYKHRYWAPEIHKLNGKFYLMMTCDNWIPEYVSVNPNGQKGLWMYIGVSDNVTGPYQHIRWLTGYGCDTTIFEDPATHYTYVCSAGNCTIQRIDLSTLTSDIITLVGNPVYNVVTAAGMSPKRVPNYLEGPWVMAKNGKFYLFHAAYYGDGCNYWTNIAIASSPMGPYTMYKGSNAGALTPGANGWGINEYTDVAAVFHGGHVGIFDGPDGRWWYCYRGEVPNINTTWQNTFGRPNIDPIDLDASGNVIPSIPRQENQPLTVSTDGMTPTPTPTATSTPTPGSAPTDYINYWKLNETSSTMAADSKGSNTGTVNGATWNTGGKYAGCLSFDGTNDYVQVSRTISDDFSISFWVKTTQTGGTGQWYLGKGLVDGEVGGVQNDFGIVLSGSKLGFGVGNPDTTIASSKNINDGVWHYCVATRQKSTGAIKIYVDGSLEASGTGGTQSLTTPGNLKFGCLQTIGNYFSGTLDDIKIFNRVLSGSEILALYAIGGSTPTPTPTPTATPTPGTTVYQASTGFSGTQGLNQWYYQQWNGSSYSNCTYDSANVRWQGTPTYLWVAANYQHPETGYDSVRKWVAPRAGTIGITGTIMVSNPSSNGIVAKILKNSTQLWSATILPTTGVNPTGVSAIAVNSGDAIYFIMNNNGSSTADQTSWDPVITLQ